MAALSQGQVAEIGERGQSGCGSRRTRRVTRKQGEDGLSREDELIQEVAELRHRLSRLSAASLRVNESLDFDTVLQDVLDSARALTRARYGLIVTMDTEGGLEAAFSSGMSEDQHRRVLELPDGMRIFDHCSSIAGALRIDSYHDYMVSLGLDGQLPMMVGAGMTAPIRHHGEVVGSLYLAHEGEDRRFSDEDEEALVMIAAQAAAVISNARRYREERAARNDLEALIDTSPIGVIVLDGATGAAIIFNREAVRIVQPLLDPDQRPEELSQLLIVTRTDGTSVSLEEFPLVELLQLGEVLRAQEYVLEVAGGGSVKVLINSTPIYTEKGELDHIIVTVQDMAPIEELERLRAEFLAMVSHELRTPLTSVKGSVTNLLDPAARLDPAEVVQFLRIIDSQTDRMRQLISDLLDVARIETGELSTQPESSLVSALIEEARAAFAISGASHKLVIDLPPQLPPAMADRQRLVQVLINLLNNAARNSPGDSTIRISASSDDVHIAISVSDAGRGIPADRLPQLFHKFSRVEAEEKGGDTGLGLAISKGIVEAHGGRIWAESSGPGQGARFTFTIPIADEGQRLEGPPSREAAPGRSVEVSEDLPRILAVDDDPEALRYIRDALTQGQFQPLLTADPAQVTQLVLDERPVLVLLDLVLPGSDGLELMRELHKIRKVPVIFLSAYGQEDTIAKAFDLGADDYLVKPFSPTELAARIRAALRRREVREPREPYIHGGLVIDYAKRMVTLDNRLVDLTSIEYRVLVDLSAHSGAVVTYEDLFMRVWGTERVEDRRPLRTAIKSVRQKLADDAGHPRYIFTENRVGYRMPGPEVGSR